MAYIDTTKEFLSDDDCMSALSNYGITLKNQRFTSYEGVYRFDVFGEIIPDTDNQITIEIHSDGKVIIEEV